MNALIAVVVGGIGLLLNIVGLAIPYWQKVDTTIGSREYSSNVGLWKVCVESTCVDVTGTDSLKAVRAMEILGMLLMIGAILCALLKLTAMKDQQILPKVAGALAIIAGVLMIIGCIIYAADVKTEDNEVLIKIVSDLHAGFALCIVAGVVSIVAGILFFVSSRGNN